MASLTGGVGLGAPGRAPRPQGPRPTKVTTQPRSTHYPGRTVTVHGSGGVGVPTGPAKPRGPTTTPGSTPPSAPGTTPGAPAYPSPYDSQYWADLAGATNKAQQQIAGYNADIANGQTNLQTAVQQLAHNQALQTTNAQNAENSRGGFAQGALGQQEGQIAQNTLQAQNADQLRFSQNAAAWNSAIAGVKQGLSIEQIALAAASAARQAALGLTSTTPGGPAAAPAPGSPGGAPTGTGAARPGGFQPYKASPTQLHAPKASGGRVDRVSVPKGTKTGFRGGPARWR